MARTLHQYHIPTKLNARVYMPVQGIIRHIGVQGGQIYMWVEALIGEPLGYRSFSLYGTGHDMPDNVGRYVGTIQFIDDQIVLNAYENMVALNTSSTWGP